MFFRAYNFIKKSMTRSFVIVLIAYNQTIKTMTKLLVILLNLLGEKVAGTKSRRVARCFGKFSVLKITGFSSHSKFQSKRSRGFDVAQMFKTKALGI